MATHQHPDRSARPSLPGLPGLLDAEGAWRPAGRLLASELPALFAAWPDEAGRIVRVLYSPPDWDDRPRSVAVGAGRRVKTGCFPADDTHQLVLTMMDGTRRVLPVAAPAAAAGDARAAARP